MAELRLAIEAGIGRIVVDSFDELDHLDMLYAETGIAPVLCGSRPASRPRPTTTSPRARTTPNSDHRLHRCRRRDRTGPDVSGRRGARHPHIGSQVFAVGSLGKAAGGIGEIATAFDFAEMSVGGGLGVPYVDDETAPTIGEWGKVVRDACAAAGVTATILADPVVQSLLRPP